MEKIFNNLLGGGGENGKMERWSERREFDKEMALFWHFDELPDWPRLDKAICAISIPHCPNSGNLGGSEVVKRKRELNLEINP